MTSALLPLTDKLKQKMTSILMSLTDKLKQKNDVDIDAA